MRYGLFSDVHGSTSTLYNALSFLRKNKVDKIYCAGDLVSYHDYSKEVVEEFRKSDIKTVMGNHDYYTTYENLSLDIFKEHSKEWILKNRKDLSKEDKSYLKSLPLIINEKDFHLVHATLNSPEKFLYVMEHEQLPQEKFHRYLTNHFLHMKKDLCFVGHTHIPCRFSVDNDWNLEIKYSYNNYVLEPNKKHVIFLPDMV